MKCLLLGRLTASALSALAGRVVSATSTMPLDASCSAWGSWISELYEKFSGFVPAHRPDSHCSMALAIIGEPAAVNWVLASGHPVVAGEKCSGITIRSFHEQKPKAGLNVNAGDAFPPLPNATSLRWSLQKNLVPTWFPPWPDTTTSEQGCRWSQPRTEFSTPVSTLMSAVPRPPDAVTAYVVLYGPAGPDTPSRPPLPAP